MQIRAVILLLIFSESVLGGVKRDAEFEMSEVPFDDSNSEEFEMTHRAKREIKLDMPIKTRYNRDLSDSTDYPSQPDEENSYVTEPSYNARTESSTHTSTNNKKHRRQSPFLPKILFNIRSLFKSVIKFFLRIPLFFIRPICKAVSRGIY